MADVEVSVGLKLDDGEVKGAGNKFAEAIKRDLQGLANSLGLGKVSSYATAGATGGASAGGGGAVAGMAVGAGIGAGITMMMGALTFIADALRDFPIVTGVMKLLKMILTILFLPIVPLLKPFLSILVNFAKMLLPVMTEMANKIQAIFDAGGGIGDVMAMIYNDYLEPAIIKFAEWLGTKLPAMAQWAGDKLANFIGVVMPKLLSTAWNALVAFIKGLVEGMMKTGLGAGIGAISGAIAGGLVFGPMGAILAGAIGAWIGGWLIPKLVEWTAVIWSWLKVAWTVLCNFILVTLPKTLLNVWNALCSFVKGLGASMGSAWSSAVTAVTKAIRAIADAISSAVNWILRLFRSSSSGKQIGGVIPKEGMYYLHAGERVISATEPNPRGKGGGIGNVNISINNPSFRKDDDIKTLVKEISRELQINTRRYMSYG